MKRKIFLLAFSLSYSFIASAQWVVSPNGTLSTSETVIMDGEVRINTPFAPLDLRTSILGILDMNATAQVGWSSGANKINFVWGMFGGSAEEGNRPALRIGKVISSEWEVPGWLSTAIGEDVGANGIYSFSVGYGTRADGAYSVALGHSSVAKGNRATALGSSRAYGNYSFAAGDSHASNGDWGTALGKSMSDGAYSLSTGQSYSLGDHSSAFGYAQGIGDYSVAGGDLAIASGTHSVAFGTHVNASGKHSFMLGGGSDFNDFKNKINNSLMIAFNCTDLPSVFVGAGDPKLEKRFGWVGIGITEPQSELAVNGTITCKELIADPGLDWPDFVFDQGYKLMSLEETEQYIKLHHHLPGVSSAKEVEEKGLKVAETSKVMMQKIEELTLHLISLQKENEALKQAIGELKKQN